MLLPWCVTLEATVDIKRQQLLRKRVHLNLPVAMMGSIKNLDCWSFSTNYANLGKLIRTH